MTAFAAEKCTPTKVANIVKDLEQKSPVGTDALAVQMYKKSLLGKEVIVQGNKAVEMRKRLEEIKNSNLAPVNKTAELNREVANIEAQIKQVNDEAMKVNASIVESEKKIVSSQKNDQQALKERMAEVAAEKKNIKLLNDKKELLRQKTIELLRLKHEAEVLVENQAELMRNRRRQVRDMYEHNINREETRKALETVRAKEFNKTIAIINKANNFTQYLRNQDRAQEMIERRQNLEQDKMAEMLRRKMLIIQEQIRTAKIEKNEEMRVQLEKQLLELKRYKKAKLQCAKNELRKYKLQQRKKIEDLKQKVLDQQLKNKLSETKNDYLAKIKAELADEIDALKKEKTVFESEKTIAQKKVAQELKIEAERLKAAQQAQVRKNRNYELNRKEMAKLRKRVAQKEIERMERKASKQILKKVIENVHEQNAIDNAVTKEILRQKEELKNKKAILKTVRNGVKDLVEKEKKEIESLKNAAIAAKQERQILKTQIAKDILLDVHNRHMKELKNQKKQIDEAVKEKIIERNRKAALKLNKANSKLSIAALQGKLDKKYILKRQQVALQNAKALSDAVKRLLPKKADSFLKLKTFKPGCKQLALKLKTPCGK